MSNLKLIIDVGKGIKDFVDALKTIDKYGKAVDRLKQNQEPFPPPKQVQKILDNNGRLEKQLELIARSGVPNPTEPKVSIDEIANPRTKPMALHKFRQGLKIRADHEKLLKGRLGELDNVAKEAKIRSRAAHEIATFWGKMVQAPLPDIGTVNKATYFGYHQLFQKLSGSLNSVERDEKAARQRFDKDLKVYGNDTINMRTNLKTFGVL